MFSKSSTIFSKSNSKVKFQDNQLDDYILENSVLKSKLQSKIDALSIMNRELDKCSMERDRYKVLVEQLKYKGSSADIENNCKFAPTKTISGGELLTKTRDQNNLLKLEVESLRSKLEDATLDIEALRKQLHKETQDEWRCKKASSNCSYSNKDYEELVENFEKFQKKYQQLKLDYRATLDERDELVCDRDYYKDKVQRLNHQISYILCNRTKQQSENQGGSDPPKPLVDIDALLTENKYLHETNSQLQVEKEIIKRTLTKYKNLLDNRNKSEGFKKGFIDVMTQKQVREFLDTNSKTGLKRATAAEMKSLCLGLFEALNDKSIALQHQRKTNQILANRISELEKTLDSWCNGQKCIPVFPSQMLLDELLPDSGSVKSEEAKEKSNEGSDNMKVEYADSEEDDKDSEGSSAPSSGVRSGTTELPYELQLLVNEALAQLKPIG